MSKIDDLVKEKCLEEVEYKTLGELGRFYGGLTGKSKEDFNNGNAIFITYKNVFLNSALNITPEDRVKIAEGERQHTLQYGDIIFTGSSETPEECGFSSVVTEVPKEELYLNSFCFFFRLNDVELFYPDFARHLFRSSVMRKQIVKTASGVTRFNVSKKLMEKVKVPIIPIAIQKEIAEVLNNMSELEAGLEAELEAELTKRKQQYTYYCDQLLDSKSKGGVEWKTVGELCDICRGVVMSKDYIRDNSGNYPVYSSQTENDGVLGRINTYNFDGDYLSWTTDGAKAGTVFRRSGKFSITNVCGLLKIKDSNLIDGDYLFYILSSLTQKYVVKGMGNAKLMSNVMASIMIPVPPKNEQKRIAGVLNSFNSITNDFSKGIPAEIEARHKQYEYYRDKLLTFKERAV